MGKAVSETERDREIPIMSDTEARWTISPSAVWLRQVANSEGNICPLLTDTFLSAPVQSAAVPIALHSQ